MAKFAILILLIAFVAVHGYSEDGKFSSRHKRMNKGKEEAFKEDEDINSIDLGTQTESKRFKHRQEVPDEVSPINPKKVFAHKKNKNKNYADQDQFEEHHSKLLGHRDEQKWRMKQNKKHQEQKRIDPDEDLHLQDLEYKKNGEGKKHQQRDQIDEEGEKNLYKKKHNKEKKNKDKKLKKEQELKKKHKKDKKEKKENKYNSDKYSSYEKSDRKP